jgi:ribosome biogenesis protein Nip4
MKPITDFVKHFGVNLNFDERFIVKQANRYFLLNEKLRNQVTDDFFYAGTYLGKVRGRVFFPSFSLLAMIAERKEASSIFVDDKAEWLFICGRDVFFRGIKKVTEAVKKGELTLVLNQYGECLGFGRIMQDLGVEHGGQRVAVKNISDVGDFLRRERRE